MKFKLKYKLLTDYDCRFAPFRVTAYKKGWFMPYHTYWSTASFNDARVNLIAWLKSNLDEFKAERNRQIGLIQSNPVPPTEQIEI
jgi:hypothetical protein